MSQHRKIEVFVILLVLTLLALSFTLPFSAGKKVADLQPQPRPLDLIPEVLARKANTQGEDPLQTTTQN